VEDIANFSQQLQDRLKALEAQLFLLEGAVRLRSSGFH